MWSTLLMEHCHVEHLPHGALSCGAPSAWSTVTWSTLRMEHCHVEHPPHGALSRGAPSTRSTAMWSTLCMEHCHVEHPPAAWSTSSITSVPCKSKFFSEGVVTCTLVREAGPSSSRHHILFSRNITVSTLCYHISPPVLSEPCHSCTLLLTKLQPS